MRDTEHRGLGQQLTDMLLDQVGKAYAAQVRQSAFYGQAAPEVEAEQEMLLQQLRVGDEPQQILCLRRLGDIASPEVIGEIMHFVAAPEEPVVEAATDAIRRIQRRVSETLPPPPPPMMPSQTVQIPVRLEPVSPPRLPPPPPPQDQDKRPRRPKGQRPPAASPPAPAKPPAAVPRPEPPRENILPQREAPLPSLPSPAALPGPAAAPADLPGLPEMAELPPAGRQD